MNDVNNVNNDNEIIRPKLKFKILDSNEIVNIVEDKPKLKIKIIDNNINKNDIVKEDDKPKLKIKVINNNNNNNIKPIINYVSDHMCYVLKSCTTKRLYIGYTTNFPRRIRQHNGEIVGGAKKTEKGRPWVPICQIKGFYDNSSALRFEWRSQHSKKPRPNSINNIITILTNLINKGDGVLSWPQLYIEWSPDFHQYDIFHNTVINLKM
jgi:predicted GIY-YIG superfamily endonuclease